jgi:hypothetical protein
VEIYIHKLNLLEDRASADYAGADARNYQEELQLMREEFQQFIEQQKVILLFSPSY